MFEFVDWIMTLPEELENGLWDEIQEMEKEKEMEYITSVQRIGRREGRREGLQEGGTNLLGRQMSKRFNIGRQALAPVFEGLTTEQIEELAEFFLDARTLEEIRERADEMRRGQ